MVSVKDIALACNVSVATVSKALNDYSDISEKTRETVRRKAAEMGYLPNLAAVALKTNRTYNIGILFYDDAGTGLTQEFFAKVLQGIKEEAEDRGYSITFINNRLGTRRVTYTEHCRHRGYDGVIIACINFKDSEVTELAKSGIPVVTIDHVYEGNISVSSDNEKGIRELIDFVHDRGHKRIAFIHGTASTVTNERLSGFDKECRKLGLNIPDEYILECPYRDIKKAAECTEELLDLDNPPTCILFPDDYTAMGGVRAIKSRGLRIPDDISVVGYDGTGYSRFNDPELATLVQDTDRMGRLAAEKLIKLIEKPEEAEITHEVIPGFVSIGKSVRKL